MKRYKKGKWAAPCSWRWCKAISELLCTLRTAQYHSDSLRCRGTNEMGLGFRCTWGRWKLGWKLGWKPARAPTSLGILIQVRVPSRPKSMVELDHDTELLQYSTYLPTSNLPGVLTYRYSSHCEEPHTHDTNWWNGMGDVTKSFGILQGRGSGKLWLTAFFPLLGYSSIAFPGISISCQVKTRHNDGLRKSEVMERQSCGMEDWWRHVKKIMASHDQKTFSNPSERIIISPSPNDWCPRTGGLNHIPILNVTRFALNASWALDCGFSLRLDGPCMVVGRPDTPT